MLPLFTKNRRVTETTKIFSLTGRGENVSEAFPDVLQLEGVLPRVQGDAARELDPERGPSKSRNETRQSKSNLFQTHPFRE